MKINTTITLSFALVALLATILGSYIVYDFSMDRTENQIAVQMTTLSESRAEHLETYLHQHIENMKLVNSRTKLRSELYEYSLDADANHLNTMTNILEDARTSVDELERICIFDLNGNLIVSTNDVFVGRNAKGMDFHTGGLVEYGVYFKFEDDVYKLLIAGPLIFEGKVIGVGITVMTLDVFTKIISSRTGLGETGEIITATKTQEGIVFLNERFFESEFQSYSEAGGTAKNPMSEALKGNELFFEKTIDYRGKDVISASKYIELGKIGLVAKMDLEEIMTPIRNEILTMSLYVLLFVFTFFIILGYFISRLISNPINKLSIDVNSITQGNLNIHLDKSKFDELNVLTSSLSRILASMKLAILRTGMRKEAFGIGEEEILKKQQEMENKLAKSNKKLEKYLEVSPGIILALDSENVVNMINKKGAKILGYDSPENIIGKNWINTFIPLTDRLLIKKRSKEVLLEKKKIPEYFENAVLCKDGSKLWIRWHSETLLNENGEVMGHLSSGTVINDIPESIFKYSKDGVFLADVKAQRYIDVNPAGIKMFLAKNKEDFLNKGPMDLSPKRQPDGSLSASHTLRRLKQAKKGKNNTFLWIHKRLNGEEFPASIALTRFKLRGRDVLLGMLRDLSDIDCKKMHEFTMDAQKFIKQHKPHNKRIIKKKVIKQKKKPLSSKSKAKINTKKLVVRRKTIKKTKERKK